MPIVVGGTGIAVALVGIVLTFMQMPVWGMVTGSVAFPMGLLGLSMVESRGSWGGRLSAMAMLLGVVGVALGALTAYGVLFPEVPGGTTEGE